LRVLYKFAQALQTASPTPEVTGRPLPPCGVQLCKPLDSAPLVGYRRYLTP
ncbi:hypothetical protein G9A89_011990, partial [Geosiphon pyriformis]